VPGCTGAPRVRICPPERPALSPSQRPLVLRLVVAATGLLLFVLSVPVACRVLGIDATTPVPELLALLPWLLVPAALALLLTAALRWRGGVLWAVVLLVVTGWFVRPYAAGAPAGSGGAVGVGSSASAAWSSGPVTARLTVLTSNVEFGQATGELITTVRKTRPDLLFVEECSLHCSDLLNAQLPHAMYPYRDIVREDGSKGSAILSVHPLKAGAGIPATMAMPGAGVRIGDRTVRLQLAHPLPPTPGQVSAWGTELGRIGAYAASGHESPSPGIIAGDFNATRDHAAFRDILTAGDLRDSAVLGGAAHTPSWPSAAPRPLGVQIDHVLVSREFSVRDARFIDLADTDHRALLVRLDLHGMTRQDQSQDPSGAGASHGGIPGRAGTTTEHVHLAGGTRT
jgi:endonuclease/exonuclease/phosphatase (EEP) superfamily protein YafD